MSRDLELAFAQETMEACEHRCAVCGYEGLYLQAHHVIEQKRIRKLGPEVLWDSRNGLALCFDPAPNRCHERHTLAVRRIPLRCLRSENFEFADEHGFAWAIDRFYASEAAA